MNISCYETLPKCSMYCRYFTLYWSRFFTDTTVQDNINQRIGLPQQVIADGTIINRLIRTERDLFADRDHAEEDNQIESEVQDHRSLRAIMLGMDRKLAEMGYKLENIRARQHNYSAPLDAVLAVLCVENSGGTYADGTDTALGDMPNDNLFPSPFTKERVATITHTDINKIHNVYNYPPTGGAYNQLSAAAKKKLLNKFLGVVLM